MIEIPSIDDDRYSHLWIDGVLPSAKSFTPRRVSIVTVCYNSSGVLEKTIRSVTDQSYDNIEYIVVDGKSTDDTSSILERNKAHIDKLVYETDEGISDAFNKGVVCATGEWILLLNAGDVFFGKNVISDMVKNTDGVQIVTGFSQSGSHTLPRRSLNNELPLYKKSFLSHQASLVHREVYQAKGLYCLALKVRMDFEFWMRVLSEYRFQFLPSILIDFDPVGTSNQNYGTYMEEEQLIVQKYCSTSPGLLIWKAWRKIGKRIQQMIS